MASSAATPASAGSSPPSSPRKPGRKPRPAPTPAAAALPPDRLDLIAQGLSGKQAIFRATPASEPGE